MSNAELEAALAGELRAVLLQLARHRSSAEQLAESLSLAQQLREALGDAPRPRWFEALHADGRTGEHHLNFNDHSLYRGRANPIATPLVSEFVTLPDGRRAVEARVACNQLYEGPPHGVHGGYVAGLFDDILGTTIRLVSGPSAVTGTLEVKYRKITPLDTELRFLAWVEHDSGRRIQSRATCHAGDVLTAEAEALFVRVDMQAIAARRPG